MIEAVSATQMAKKPPRAASSAPSAANGKNKDGHPAALTFALNDFIIVPVQLVLQPVFDIFIAGQVMKAGVAIWLILFVV